MKSPDGTTRSSWHRGVKIPSRAPLARSARADVCVVGAGIAGLTAAYLLASEGKSVIVLDEGPVGSGQTGRTSAHLSSVLDDRFTHIEKLHGVEASRLARESHAAAIDSIERISRDEQVACDFARVDGFLMAAPDRPKDELEKEFAAAKRAGASVTRHARCDLGRGACLRFRNQAVFHPLKYLVGLAAAVERKGGRIYCGHRVMDVQGADTKKGSPAKVQLPRRVVVKADSVVVATNTPSPINDWFGIYTKQASYRTYMIGASVPRGTIADALFWDTADPYHYVRVQHERTGRYDLLLVGGEDHKTGQHPDGRDPFAELEAWARQRVPALGRVRFRWSGQVQEPADGLAFIGRALTANENVFVATGDSGIGLTHGTIAGLLITDLIRERANPWEQLYDPSRKMLNREFVRENANTLGQYKDLLTPGEVTAVGEIRPGEGAILRNKLTKLAVYRDPKGKLHRRSAICTHLQCVVRWNGIEKTWDCPCHGSRFDPLGKVLMGPAIDDLPSAK